MKNFLTSMLGALAALALFAAGAALVLFIALGAIATVGQRSQLVGRIEAGSYLVFDLSTNITDAPPEFDLSSLGEDRGTEQLRTVTRALRAAALDSRIKGVLLKGTFEPAGYGTGFAALREVRDALRAFHKVGKPVIAYLDLATTRDYYVASEADRVALDPYGLILMPGLAVEPAFFAGAFEKYGVGVQVTRVGKYKSFVEPFVRKDMSPENREQTQKVLDDLWQSMLADIGRSRRIEPADIQAVADSEGLIRAEPALRSRLVDRVEYWDQVVDELKAATDRADSKEGPKEVTLAAYARELSSEDGKTGGNAVAVVYAEGDIVDGDGESGEIGGAEYARELRSLREDDDVKAVVLRVNSPGGSATAAEAIGREIRLLREARKPVIVSMGTYAASGGYWISAYGDRIFAEPTTITGSIGVFGIEFDVQKLAGDFGITFDRVKTGKFADAMTISRPKTPEELAVLQRLVDWIYSQFVAKVAEGRHLKPDYVEDIAQGRVWSGAAAKKLGLVDELGGLSDAIRYAVKSAGLEGNYRVVEYPPKKDLEEELKELIGKLSPDAFAKSADPATAVFRRLKEELALLRSFNDPENVYARLPVDLTLR